MAGLGQTRASLTAASPFVNVGLLSDEKMPADGSTEDQTAAHVSVDRSAVRLLNASVANLDRSAVQRLAAESVIAENSAVAVANASTVELRQSAVGIAAGDYVRVEDSKVFLLLAPRVSGNVRAVLTAPAALALGVGIVLGRALVATLRRKRSAS